MIYECHRCGYLAHVQPPMPVACPVCLENAREAVEMRAAEAPPLTRDYLLAEIARSLRATHPERAEQLIAAVEKAMPAPHSGPATFLHPATANEMIARFGQLPRGVFVTVPVDIATGREPMTLEDVHRPKLG